MKKSQSMPLNVVVVAALILLTLIVVVVFFSGRFKILAATSKSCETQQGECRSSCLEGETNIGGTSCDGTSTPKCCIKVFT
ncbi:MAG: hypothetical protein V1859_06055 [archaeon]